MAKRRSEKLDELHKSLGAYTAEVGSPKIAGEVFGVSRGKAHYWKRKQQDPTFRSGTWGGARESNFLFPDPEVRAEFELCLWNIVTQFPHFNAREMQTALVQSGFNVERSFIYQTLHNWRWCTRKSCPRQIDKYSLSNIVHYLEHVEDVSDVDIELLIYMDEMAARGTEVERRRVWGRFSSGGIPPTIASSPLDGDSYSVMMMIRANSADCLYTTINQGTNNAEDFAEFVINAVSAGFLKEGNILILDNAKIHRARDILDAVSALLEELDIRIWFLPTYSPELNPCELVFGQVKRWLRNNRGYVPLLEDLVTAFASVSQDNIKSYYRKCIESFASSPFFVPPGVVIDL